MFVRVLGPPLGGHDLVKLPRATLADGRAGMVRAKWADLQIAVVALSYAAYVQSETDKHGHGKTYTLCCTLAIASMHMSV